MSEPGKGRTTRDDFLKECMSEVPPMAMDAFNKVFCTVCGNRGCSRSGLNNSVFDRRVLGWKENLFIHPPQAAPDDPRFDNIRGKQFLPIAGAQASMIHEIQTPVAKPPPKFVPGPAEAPGEAGPAPETPDAPVAARQEVLAPAPPVPAPAPPSEASVPAPQVPGFGNTSFRQGEVLDGGPQGQKLSDDKTYVLGDD